MECRNTYADWLITRINDINEEINNFIGLAKKIKLSAFFQSTYRKLYCYIRYQQML